MSEEEQLAADTKKAIKASKEAHRIQQQSTCSSEGDGITLEGFEDDSAQSDDKHVNEGEIEWLPSDDEEKVKDDDEDDMDDDRFIDIEETNDDERMESDHDDQVMHDTKRAEEERDADKEITRDEHAVDDQVEDDQEIPTVLSAMLLDVLVSVIPKKPTPPTPTPLPTPPITSEAPPVTTTVPDPLPAVIQRLDNLERKFVALLSQL
ncbi:hypothetical protein Tco_1228587 [Tanacetum coccineum]